jgi:hypothetical protein
MPQGVVTTLVGPEVDLCSPSDRFTRADLLEHICVISPGGLSLAEIVTLMRSL